jgi:hypothetical protein
MKRANPTAIVAALAVSLCGAGRALAGAITTLPAITANTQGWVSSAGAHSSSPAYIMVGYCGVETCDFGDDGEYRNYFQFSIPTITGTVVSAQLAISQTAADYTRSFDYSPTLTYDVTSIPGGNVTFDNLGKGKPYGTRVCQDSDYSVNVAFTMIYIDLNPEALRDIMASQNGTFWLSGRLESAETELAASKFSEQPNGWIMGGPLPLQQLIITTGDAPSSTPEPASLFLLAPGVAVLVFRQRRGRAVR